MATKGWSLGALVAAFKAGAFADFGTTAGTVAQGNDTRIVHAVQDTNTALTMPGTINSTSTLTCINGNVVANNGGMIARDPTMSSMHQPDGNISGVVWEGNYLNIHINNRTNTGSISYNGYFKDTRTGLILQWATGGGQYPEGGQRVNFVTSFPTAIFYAGVFTRTANGVVDSEYNAMYQMKSFDTAGANTYLQGLHGGGAFVPDVWAIGK